MKQMQVEKSHQFQSRKVLNPKKHAQYFQTKEGEEHFRVLQDDDYWFEFIDDDNPYRIKNWKLSPEFFAMQNDTILKGSSLLKGLRLYDYEGWDGPYWQETSNCFYAMTNVTWSTYPMWLTYVQAHNPGRFAKHQATAEMM